MIFIVLGENFQIIPINQYLFVTEFFVNKFYCTFNTVK